MQNIITSTTPRLASNFQIPPTPPQLTAFLASLRKIHHAPHPLVPNRLRLASNFQPHPRGKNSLRRRSKTRGFFQKKGGAWLGGKNFPGFAISAEGFSPRPPAHFQNPVLTSFRKNRRFFAFHAPTAVFTLRRPIHQILRGPSQKANPHVTIRFPLILFFGGSCCVCRGDYSGESPSQGVCS